VPRIGDHLHETRWRVETIQGRAVVRSAAPTLEFLRDDHLRGGTGCNRFVGPWHTRAARAVMGPLRKSRLSCRADLAQQEQQLLDTLERTERFELKDEGRTLLVYSSLSTAPSRFTRLP
jgi:heat shock protein HslJ